MIFERPSPSLLFVRVSRLSGIASVCVSPIGGRFVGCTCHASVKSQYIVDLFDVIMWFDEMVPNRLRNSKERESFCSHMSISERPHPPQYVFGRDVREREQSFDVTEHTQKSLR